MRTSHRSLVSEAPAVPSPAAAFCHSVFCFPFGLRAKPAIRVVVLVAGLAALPFRGGGAGGLAGVSRADGDGHAEAAGLPLTWSETNHVEWKTEIPLRGWSTPVVLGGQVW